MKANEQATEKGGGWEQEPLALDAWVGFCGLVWLGLLWFGFSQEDKSPSGLPGPSHQPNSL